MDSVTVDIQTEYLSDTSLERCLHATSLGDRAKCYRTLYNTVIKRT
jgi:hypothetical protein